MVARAERVGAMGFLVAVSGLAGCLAGDVPKGPAMIDPLGHYLPDVFPYDLDHDHADAALHDAAFGLRFVGYHACTAPGTVDSATGGYTDVAFHDDLAFVGTGGGFCILDVADPAHPRFVSSYEGEAASDLEISHDGRFVFLLTQRNRATALVDPPTSPTPNLPRGVIVVNVQDAGQPRFESYYPLPTNGVHTATPYLHGDRQLLIVQTYDWLPPRELLPAGLDPPTPEVNAPLTPRVEITELVPVGQSQQLVRLAAWSLDRPAAEPFARWFPHDAFAQFHPLAQKHLLYVAYWDAGLVILDIDDPSQPRPVSRFDAREPSVYNQYHDVEAFADLIEGRHITVTAPEIPSGPVAGHVRVFDTTDPARPIQLGTWRLPGDPGTPGGFLFSPHVLTLDRGRILIGHNHAGAWVIDVHNETLLRKPATAGFFAPRGDESAHAWSRSISVWGAYVHEGLVYATESGSGVHVLAWNSTAPPSDRPPV